MNLWKTEISIEYYARRDRSSNKAIKMWQKKNIISSWLVAFISHANSPTKITFAHGVEQKSAFIIECTMRWEMNCAKHTFLSLVWFWLKQRVYFLCAIHILFIVIWLSPTDEANNKIIFNATQFSFLLLLLSFDKDRCADRPIWIKLPKQNRKWTKLETKNDLFFLLSTPFFNAAEKLFCRQIEHR